MRTLLLICALLCAVCTAHADRRALLFNRTVAAAGGGGGGTCTTCSNELYEATGYDLAGWNAAGSTFPDQTTTALEGAQTLVIANTGFDTSYTYLNMPTDTQGWDVFMLRISNSIPNGLTLATFSDNTSAHQFRLLINSSQLRVAAGATTANTVTTLSANTTYWVRVGFKTGSGSAEMSVGFSTTTTIPTSGNGYASFNTGTVTPNMIQYALMAGDLSFSGAAGNVFFDNVRLRNGATPIPDP